MKSVIVIVCGLFLVGGIYATDFTFTSGSGYWTNKAQWGGAAYPGQNSADDRAIFTNTLATTVTSDQSVTLSDGYFRNPLNSVTLILTNSALTFTNSFQIGDAGTTGNVTLAASTGSLVITNAAKTGSLVVGTATGKGTLVFNGGTVTCNQFIATNITTTVTNSIIGGTGSMSQGIGAGSTLTTTNTPGSLASSLVLQNRNSTTFYLHGTWNMYGGLNTMTNLGTFPAFYVGNSDYGLLRVISGAMFDFQGIQLYEYTYGAPGGIFVNGGVMTNLSGIIMGFGTQGSNSIFTVSNGGAVYSSGSLVIGNQGSVGNIMTIDNGTCSLGNIRVGVGDPVSGAGVSGNNTLIVTNGGLLSYNNVLQLGYNPVGAYGSRWNTISVSGTNGAGAKSTIYSSTSSLGIGLAPFCSNNTFTIGADGVVTGVTTITVGGASSNNAYNILILTNGGQLYSSGALTISSATASNNLLYVGAGSLLESLSQTVYPGNLLSNDGGIFQYASATPTLTPNGFGNIAINNGTISFRGIDTANVTNNWNGMLTNIMYSGANAFRLNAATNTAAVTQTYVFDPNLGPTNYARLELVNGSTCYRGMVGNSLTIGTNITSGGVMLCSNTTASVSLTFTNNGTLTVFNSTLTFATNVTLNGTLVIDSDHLASLNGVVLASNLTLGASSALVVTGHGTNAVLLTYRNLIGNSNFGSITVPAGYSLGRPANGQLILRLGTGTSVYFH